MPKWISCLLLITLSCNIASAEQTNYYNKYGKFTGRSINGTYYDSHGKQTGKEINGKFYDALGKYSGTIQNSKNNKNGSSANKTNPIKPGTMPNLGSKPSGNGHK